MRSAKSKMRASCVTTMTARSVWTASSAHQFHDPAPRLAVERAGRFVTNDQAWLVDERARNRDALLLSAREIDRQRLRHAPIQADAIQNIVGRGDGGPPRRAVDDERRGHILGGGQGWDQIEGLEDKADVPAAEARRLVRPHLLVVVLEDGAVAAIAVGGRRRGRKSVSSSRSRTVQRA